MPRTRIDFGSLTADETKSVAINALNELTWDERIEVVVQFFKNADAKAELMANLED